MVFTYYSNPSDLDSVAGSFEVTITASTSEQTVAETFALTFYKPCDSSLILQTIQTYAQLNEQFTYPIAGGPETYRLAMREIERQIERLQSEESITWYSCGPVEKHLTEVSQVEYTLDENDYDFAIDTDDTSFHN